MLNSSEHVNLLMSLMWDSNFFNLLFLNNPSLLSKVGKFFLKYCQIMERVTPVGFCFSS